MPSVKFTDNPAEENFNDTKELIRSHKSNDRQYNVQKKDKH